MLTVLPLAIIILAGLYVVLAYNSLVNLKNQIKNAWAQIDVQLKRRHDLIPNFVETVKGYAKHEREVFENVTLARSRAMGASTVGEKSQAETGLSAAIGRLFAVAENYPELKADRSFLGLQEELSSTENRIAFARQNYNDQVLFYNNKIQMFPSNLVAAWFKFLKEEFFEIEEKAQREAPRVSF